MPIPHGSEITSAPPQETGLYGYAGWEAGRFAVCLSHSLQETNPVMAVTADGAPSWDANDSRAYHDYVDFQGWIPFMEPEPEVDGSDVATLHRNLQQFQTRLPFSEAERAWMLAAGRSLHALGIELVQGLVAAESTIVSAGLRQPVRGSDLVRRWSAWRRQTDEFTGQGTAHEARQLLRGIAVTLLPAAELRKEDAYAARRSANIG